uniref:DNA-directed RNA polymerase n=1 Tax=Nephromyces sp. ex Molgula occidentalis TaxID=2544991 RepID=A0A5C1H9C3_9APIC|nr:plastid-encoded DNA-directed RNA polymerase beta''B [Nephromyces sp. ex Molgula occidentalis]
MIILLNKIFFIKNFKLNNLILYNKYNFNKYKNLITNYFKFFNFKTKIKEVPLKFKYDNYEFINYKSKNYFINFLNNNQSLSFIDYKYYKLLGFKNFNSIHSNLIKKQINNSLLLPKNIQINNIHKNIINSNKSIIPHNIIFSSKSPKEKEFNLKLTKYINKYNFINNIYSLNLNNSLKTLYSNLISPKTSSDIISGLQYIETIFESKTKLNESFIINKGYLINETSYNNYDKINKIYLNKVIIFNTSNQYSVWLGISKSIKSFLIEPTSIVSGGDIIMQSSYDPSSLLDLKFKTLSSYFNQFKSIKISFNFIFNIIIESLSKQYLSNNINIPIIYFEILVKKMTSCVKIINSGNSYFKNEDILPLNIVHLTNVSYILHNNNQILYKPKLLGISRSILASSGFLTAASFQHTIRILIKSALENQIDWLVDLKSKLILSDLIPTGSGWYRFFNKSLI